jgi:hypothetical protein
MNKTTKYRIGELSAASGISRRAVRFYVQSGIIDPPCGRGRGSYYTEEHLRQIRSHRRGFTARKETPPSLDIAEKRDLPFDRLIRIPLVGGAFLELPYGADFPDKKQLDAIAEIIAKLLN